MRIRPLQPADIDPIVQWMLHVPLWQRYGFTVERGVAQFTRAYEQGTILLVADLPEQTACGFAWAKLNAAFAHSAYLQLIGVHPDYHGRAIGGALLTAVEETVRPHSSALFLLASDFNTLAHGFYRRQGYAQIGVIPGYVLPDVDEFIFYKRLVEQWG